MSGTNSYAECRSDIIPVLTTSFVGGGTVSFCPLTVRFEFFESLNNHLEDLKTRWFLPKNKVIDCAQVSRRLEGWKSMKKKRQRVTEDNLGGMM